MLSVLHLPKRFRRARESSYDRGGGGRDFVRIAAGQAHAVPTLAGPGVIRHLWLTLGHFYHLTAYQDTRLEITFDGAAAPQVDVPLADFFGFGHGALVDVNSWPLQVWRSNEVDRPPYLGALNCLFPMPFAQTAAIRIVNGSDAPRPFHLHYYVDWEQHGPPAEPPLYFHGTFHEEWTEPPPGQPPSVHGRGNPDTPNQSDADNYCFLAVQGYRGHYVGTGLSVAFAPGDPGKWWEGDDMFVLDGEPWPPRLHGTGHEDYFNIAYGFQRSGTRPEFGVTFLDRPPRADAGESVRVDGHYSMYRFHIHDPIPFEHSIVASIEHGHANDCKAHYRSVAYWYGRSLTAEG